MNNLFKIVCICLFVSTRINAQGSISINSGLYNVLPRPVISAGTMEYGEIRGYSLHGNLMDDGFLRLSAGAGTTPWTKSYIDMSGYSTVPDMDRNIVFGTSGTERMRINQYGNVGIGTLTPGTKLSVLGVISKLTETGIDGTFDNLIKYGHKSDLESATSYANRWHGIDATITAGTAEQNKLKFKLYSGGTGNLTPVDVMTLVGNGNVGIGTSTPSNVQGWGRVFDVAGVDNSKILATSRNGLSRVGIFSHNDWYGGGGFVGTESNHSLHLITNYNVKMSILTNGNVGVGTVNPDSKLTVAGNIHAQEVKVTARAGEVPDYVFANDYKLKSLEEVERYIKQNSHLPEIPSAKEIEKNGLMLAEMNLSLLKKMEEMTLYMIEQNKRIKDLEKQIEEIKRK
ncbi:tail fiber protein [Flavobacterium sp. B183]|uniref:tail fiber protein n=1 Tax=Flavobacterium sp. B183 TaxID=907046 RepID=UPI00201FAB1C|nr:tail fiber protein [Flavobacterium sp. B183]URC13521.1 tail fiber protein [Flavobacterium sp. B183]